MEIVAVDIGGTHARFATATITDGRVSKLDEPVTLKTSGHASLEAAWRAFAAQAGHVLPRAAAIAVAGPAEGDVLRLTNSPWTIRPAALAQELNLERFILINDFVAIGHAIGAVDDRHLRHVCGPDRPLPASGAVSIVGPGTGLGVAYLLRQEGRSLVVGTEGGHIDFAPVDALEDRILSLLRERYLRVSAERIVSGPGLTNIYEAMARIGNRSIQMRDDVALWKAALDGSDDLAATALERFCLSLGSVAGDIALAQGATALVIAGGIGLRLADHLAMSGFQQRFTAKGRFEKKMADMPVKLITHPQPGLLGVAAAFAARG